MRRIKPIIGFTITFTLFITFTVIAKYIPNNKDTKLPPEKVEIVIEDPTDFQLLKSTENYDFYFKDERDVIAIYDKRNQYLWKTGLDIPFSQDVKDACEDAPMEEKSEVCVPIEDRLNATYTGIANSLVTIEYWDTSLTTKRISSASRSDVESELKQVTGDDSHYILEVKFKKPKIELKVHIYFTEKGLSYEIRDEEIRGDEREMLASIILTPFLGASGGKEIHYNPGLLDEDGNYLLDEFGYPIDEGEYSGNGTYVRNPETGEIELDQLGRPMKNEEPVAKKNIPGYVLVPDGSGTLIRFNDYNTPLSTYYGSIYGDDYSLNYMYDTTESGFVKYKQPTIPVFGIAHGNDQAAFVAYATEGDEVMEIVVTPDEVERTHYNWAYPRFTYSSKYFQIYNRQGAGFEKLLDEEQKQRFDIQMTYEFLANDGSNGEHPANYIGMAKTYRDHLISEGILTPIHTSSNQIPIRIDFLMSDAKRNIIGFENVVVTKIMDVQEILLDLKETGISNMNSGLIGYQEGGATLGRPDEIDYSRDIGTKRAFKDVFKTLKDEGIDVSLSQDFTRINEEQMNLRGNAIRHATNWYTRTYLFDAESPINTLYYARASKSRSWLKAHVNEVKDLGPQSLTIDGMQNILFADYTNGLTSRSKAIAIYEEAFKFASEGYKMNAKNPNLYAWQYIDRYLDAPVFSSQYIISTDTVPFLQLVLQGTMELYAPYSNFSFYTDSDILRMIDYNVYPSFVLTKEPAHLLMATNSANYYSTEYELYKPLIEDIYQKVNGALGEVINSEWTDRTVLADGVILNSYENGVEIVINYTDEVHIYEGVRVEPLSYGIIH